MPIPSIPRVAAVARIRRKWAEADDIQSEGRCDNCKHDSALWSFVLSDYRATDVQGNEPCGFWCAACGWSNAGSRPSLDVETGKADGQ